MATRYLINNCRFGTNTFYAGSSYDTANDAAQIAQLQSAGGVLLLDPTGGLATAALVAQQLRLAGAPPEEFQAAMLAAADEAAAAGSVPTTRTLTAGAGLTGGGDLSANRTLDVGAGSGITVNANDVAVTFGLVGEMAAAGVTTANATGTVAKSAHIDHAHAHGSQTDGTMHAAAVSGGASGFMTGADKAKEDAYPTNAGMTTGNVVQATSATTFGLAPINLAGGPNFVANVLPAANVSREAGLEHSVRGIVDANVADLANFTVAGNDGLTYAEGERVGLVNQTTGTQDGPYVVGVVAVGVAPLTRAPDWAAAAVLPAGSSMRANDGTVWKGHVWYATVAGAITVDTTDPDFYPRRQSGTTAAMSTGVTVSNVWLKSASQASSPISTQINTGGGTVGFTTVPGASRTPGAGSGSFAITGDALDTSTIDWIVEN